ncbi:MAG: peptidyl-prolyl cis-trans isomerase, partial [Smithellaceae bacterium]|nr:peptidyl-prolyl cis-trans isomerase [Smithellaceae bacterium]
MKIRLKGDRPRFTDAAKRSRRIGTVSFHPPMGTPKALVRIILAAMAILLLFSCQDPAPSKPYVATVNGEKIYLFELEDKIKNEISLVRGLAPIGEGEFVRIREAVLDSIVLEKLLRQRALSLNISISAQELDRALAELQGQYSAEEFQEILARNKTDMEIFKEGLRNQLLMDRLVEREVFGKVTVTEAEALAFFQQNKGKYSAKKAVRVAQIVVREKAKAEAALKRLRSGEDFGKVAQDLSIGPEALRGGDLGFLEEGIMPESFERAAFSLPVGKHSGIIKTNYGYHIINVIERNGEGEKSFARLKTRILIDLRRVKQEKA